MKNDWNLRNMRQKTSAEELNIVEQSTYVLYEK